MKSYSLRLLVLCSLSVFLTHIVAQNNSYNPPTEIRAVWLTTNWQLDWPSDNFSSDAQQKELIAILDELQKANFNVVFFQVRIRGDVFYKSNIEPISPFFLKNVRSAYNISYDPLAFAIQECHRRGINCHAWFVTFPVGSKKQVEAQGNSSVVKRQPGLCKLHLGEWYLDPGNPLARYYILSLVDEIVANYDIDGIHLDYIRYPENANKFPDNDTFRKYGRGLSLDEWRRQNINNLVSDIYYQTKKTKPWVEVSASPLGRYKTLNPRKGTWTAYESVHQDAGLWMEEGIVDAIYPMMYYNDNNFSQYLKEWEKKSNGRFVVPGLGVYRLLREEGDWTSRDIVEQMNVIRYNRSAGMAFFRAGNIIHNVKNIRHVIESNYFSYPAKLPPMTWLKSTPPAIPLGLQIYRNGDLLIVEWLPGDNQQQTFTLYQSYSKNIDTTDPRNILITRVHGNKVYLRIRNEQNGIYYAVTATDRYNNESRPTSSAFFVLSSDIQK